MELEFYFREKKKRDSAYTTSEESLPLSMELYMKMKCQASNLLSV